MKKNDFLRTPKWVYESLGNIDLDPCASGGFVKTSIGNENYSLENGVDGLSVDWNGFVFCNPPFSQKEAWIEKMCNHGLGILLLPERGSTPWFGPLAFSCKYTWTMGKKINFDGGPSSNPLGTTLFLFGDESVQRVINSGLPGFLSEIKYFRPRYET